MKKRRKTLRVNVSNKFLDTLFDWCLKFIIKAALDHAALSACQFLPIPGAAVWFMVCAALVIFAATSRDGR